MQRDILIKRFNECDALGPPPTQVCSVAVSHPGKRRGELLSWQRRGGHRVWRYHILSKWHPLAPLGPSAEFGDERGGCGYPFSLLLCKPCLSKSQCLRLARLVSRDEFFLCIVLGDELRLNFAEGDFGLLTRFTECLRHRCPIFRSCDKMQSHDDHLDRPLMSMRKMIGEASRSLLDWKEITPSRGFELIAGIVQRMSFIEKRTDRSISACNCGKWHDLLC
jgi:hypothetical protein